MHQQSGGGQLGLLTDGLTLGSKGHCVHMCVCGWTMGSVCEEEGEEEEEGSSKT